MPLPPPNLDNQIKAAEREAQNPKNSRENQIRAWDRAGRLKAMKKERERGKSED